MAIPVGALKTVATGTLASGEVFAHSQWFDGSSSIGSAASRASAETDINNLFANDFLTAGTLNLFANSVQWRQMLFYWYNGGSAAAFTGQTVFTGKVGTQAGATLPQQVALAVTQRTDRAGRSYRGRSYLPSLAATYAGTSGLLSSALAQNLATAYALWLSDCLGRSPSIIPAVMSAKQSVLTPITVVDVDTRFDVQRSRANKVTGAQQMSARVS